MDISKQTSTLTLLLLSLVATSKKIGTVAETSLRLAIII
jgi:hypothetical protein